MMFYLIPHDLPKGPAMLVGTDGKTFLVGKKIGCARLELDKGYAIHGTDGGDTRGVCNCLAKAVRGEPLSVENAAKIAVTALQEGLAGNDTFNKENLHIVLVDSTGVRDYSFPGFA